MAHAEDCTQEAFIRARRALPRFEARSAFGAWLHRIAVNVVLERRRQGGPVLEFVASPPDGARDALVLCAIHGYTAAEAGTMLGLAQGTCKAQVHRARQLLRERLERGLGHAGGSPPRITGDRS